MSNKTVRRTKYVDLLYKQSHYAERETALREKNDNLQLLLQQYNNLLKNIEKKHSKQTFQDCMSALHRVIKDLKANMDPQLSAQVDQLVEAKFKGKMENVFKKDAKHYKKGSAVVNAFSVELLSLVQKQINNNTKIIEQFKSDQENVNAVLGSRIKRFFLWLAYALTPKHASLSELQAYKKNKQTFVAQGVNANKPIISDVEAPVLKKTETSPKKFGKSTKNPRFFTVVKSVPVEAVADTATLGM